MANTDTYYSFDESFEPAGEKYPSRSFSTLSDLSKWLYTLLDPQGELSETLVAKARDLVSKKNNQFNRIAAVCRYVQGVRYLAAGGAYKPRPASEVFASGYGDCKDKANLLRTMLHSVGVEAWLAAINTREADAFTDRPRLDRFNHFVIGIRVSIRVKAESVAKYPPFGALLFFDPTDERIPLGRLPAHEFGIQALIVAGENGRLVRLPSRQVAPPAGRRRELSASADNGTTAGRVELSRGAAAAASRGLRNSGNLPKKKPAVARKVPVKR
jgi:hypothetical protein